MTSRQAVWTVPAIQALCQKLVPVGDSIERPGTALDEESNTSFESRLVRRVKTQCNDSYSYQGMFVATPSGLLLAGSHEAPRDPVKAEQVLREGLEKWHNVSPAERLMTKEVFAEAVAELAKEEEKRQYPEDGLVLRVICRDLPLSDPTQFKGDDVHRKMYNQDYAWFRKAEARTFLPGEMVVGAKHKVPREVVARLVRFHFVDLVRGHTSPYPLEAVEQADLTAEVLELKGEFVVLRYEGQTRSSETHNGVHLEGKWNRPGPGIPAVQSRGVAAQLEGYAVYDQKAEKFVSFEMAAATERWGGNAYNGRLQFLDFGPGPMGLAIDLAGDNAAEQLPPLFFRNYGW